MRLSKLAIIVCRGHKGIRSELAKVLNVADSTIYRIIRDNEDNGALTTASALRVIREESGLRDDQLLEEVKESVGQN